LSPDHGVEGDEITITGTGYLATQGESQVLFNGIEATGILSWSPTQIVVQVPAGATTGPVTVIVNGQSSRGLLFTVSESVTQQFFELTRELLTKLGERDFDVADSIEAADSVLDYLPSFTAAELLQLDQVISNEISLSDISLAISMFPAEEQQEAECAAAAQSATTSCEDWQEAKLILSTAIGAISKVSDALDVYELWRSRGLNPLTLAIGTVAKAIKWIIDMTIDDYPPEITEANLTKTYVLKGAASSEVAWGWASDNDHDVLTPDYGLRDVYATSDPDAFATVEHHIQAEPCLGPWGASWHLQVEVPQESNLRHGDEFGVSVCAEDVVGNQGPCWNIALTVVEQITITFDEYAQGTPITNQYQDRAVVFSSETVPPTIEPAWWVEDPETDQPALQAPANSDQSAAGPFNVWFVDTTDGAPIEATDVSFWYYFLVRGPYGSLVVTYYDIDGRVISQEDLVQNPGAPIPDRFHRIHFDPNNNWYFHIDDLSFKPSFPPR
jgi:hypothetical protein